MQDDPAERLAALMATAPTRQLNHIVEEIDSLVHDAKSIEASLINNDGPEAQFAYLLDAGYTEDELKEIIEANTDTTETYIDD